MGVLYYKQGRGFKALLDGNKFHFYLDKILKNYYPEY